jgi:c-di-GMP-binding flagellar brake protein YcgR
MDLEKVQENLLHGKILNIGLGTQLKVQLAGMDGHFKSIMIGMSPEEYLLIKLPMMPGILAKLYQGNRAIVRYIYAGSVYGFSSTVLHFITKPSPLLFLNYPKSVEILELRESKRVDCFFPGRMKIEEKDFQGTIVDISAGGCQFSIDASGDVKVPQMEVGAAIDLSFQLIGSQRPLAALGKVRTVSRGQGKVVVGIQFEALDPEILESIEGLVKSFWPIDDDHPSLG